MLSCVRDDSPDVMGPSSGKKRGRQGQTTRREQLDLDGPVVLAAIIADDEGKWSFLSGVENTACDALKRRLGPYIRCVPGDASGGPSAVALAVIRSWRFVQRSFTSVDAHEMASAAVSCRPRQAAVRFLEHEVLRVVMIPSSCGRSIYEAFSGRAQLIAEVPLRSLLMRVDTVVHGMSGWLGEIIRQWLEVHPTLLHSGLIGWPIWTPMARAIANGDWTCDVSVIFQRQDPRYPCIHAATLPSPRVLTLFRKLDTILDMPTRPEGALALASGGCDLRKRGMVQSWSARSLLIALEFGTFLLKQADLHKASRAGTRCYAHFDKSSVPESLKNGPSARMPSKSSLYRGRITLDIATMLARREVRAFEGPSFRHLGFDASPQRGGVEVFATLERTILKKDLIGEAPHRPFLPSAAYTRRLPLAALGQGRASLADKVHAQVNQCWLEHGGSIESFLASNLDVRTIISDMGVESGIADYVDVTNDGFSNPTKPSPLRSMNGYLYPLALFIPGPQHAIDLIVKGSLDGVEWWPDWSAEAKVLCQWVNRKAHRAKLQEILRERHLQDPYTLADLDELRKALDNGCDSFANWRWKTLSNVTRDLMRLRRSLVETIGRASVPSDLGLSDQSAQLVKDLTGATNSELFWARTRTLKKCIKPLASFSSWLRGCACHEEDRLAGRRVVCSWGGCRAPELSARVLQARNELDLLRRQAEALEGIGAEVLHTIASTMLANILTRFAWVDELPYLILKVSRGGGWSRHSALSQRSGLAVYAFLFSLLGRGLLHKLNTTEERKWAGPMWTPFHYFCVCKTSLPTPPTGP